MNLEKEREDEKKQYNDIYEKIEKNRKVSAEEIIFAIYSIYNINSNSTHIYKTTQIIKNLSSQEFEYADTNKFPKFIKYCDAETRILCNLIVETKFILSNNDNKTEEIGAGGGGIDYKNRSNVNFKRILSFCTHAIFIPLFQKLNDIEKMIIVYDRIGDWYKHKLHDLPSFNKLSGYDFHANNVKCPLDCYFNNNIERYERFDKGFFKCMQKHHLKNLIFSKKTKNCLTGKQLARIFEILDKKVQITDDLWVEDLSTSKYEKKTKILSKLINLGRIKKINISWMEKFMSSGNAVSITALKQLYNMDEIKNLVCKSGLQGKYKSIKISTTLRDVLIMIKTKTIDKKSDNSSRIIQTINSYKLTPTYECLLESIKSDKITVATNLLQEHKIKPKQECLDLIIKLFGRTHNIENYYTIIRLCIKTFGLTINPSHYQIINKNWELYCFLRGSKQKKLTDKLFDINQKFADRCGNIHVLYDLFVTNKYNLKPNQEIFKYFIDCSGSHDQNYSGKINKLIEIFTEAGFHCTQEQFNIIACNYDKRLKFLYNSMKK
jgi:hypothetical protein